MFGHQRLDDVTPREVAEFKRQRRAKAAANQELIILALLYRYARSEGWWEGLDTPVDGIVRGGNPPPRRVASPEEVAKLLLAAEPMWQRIIEFALLTGARPGEIRALRRDAITEYGVIIRRSKTRTESLVRWSDALRETIDGALGLQPAQRPSLYVFPRRGGPYTTHGFTAAWSSLRARAGVMDDLQLRDLRRTAATAAQDLEHARALLGHTSPAMTGRVYRVRDEVKPTR